MEHISDYFYETQRVMQRQRLTDSSIPAMLLDPFKDEVDMCGVLQHAYHRMLTQRPLVAGRWTCDGRHTRNIYL
jgi:hypothetical protein